MSIVIRKEQVLAGLTVLVAALIVPGYLAEPAPIKALKAEIEAYQPEEPRSLALADAKAPPASRRDPCIEPSETQPLPPRPIRFPPCPPLSVVGLPLEPGPDAGSWALLAIDGEPVRDVTIDTASGSAAAAGSDGPPEGEVAEPTRIERERVAALSYDRLYIGGLSNPFFGTLLAEPGQDLLALERSSDLEGVVLRMRLYDTEKRRSGAVRAFGADGPKIDKIVLAGTTRNEVARRVRDVGSTPAARRELVLWLLDQARVEAWIYDEALKQARTYRTMPNVTDGWRLEQMVLRARGDLSGEVALLEGIDGNGIDAAYRFEGLGLVKARLGLWLEAEHDLREAVARAHGDGRVYASLAEFLRQRGRPGEAIAVARQAEASLASVPTTAEIAQVLRIVVACKLAIGDLAGAKQTLGAIPAAHPQPYLTGCFAYASGDVAAALTAFRQVDGPDAGSAQLGQAACLLRTGQWQEAHDLFVKTAAAEPLLRHRAYTGLALLWVRVGELDAALSALDRALEADPTDLYAHYLRGRCMRQLGQSGAAAALHTALRQRDDFVFAIAEMALVEEAKGRELPFAERAESLLAARRYADRAVQLASPRHELFVLQGLEAFHAADQTAATAAFTRAREAATDERGRAFARGANAVVDYSRGQVDDVATDLQRLAGDLPKDDPLAQWAESTVVAIIDHGQKEQLGDGFQRGELGGMWKAHNDGTLQPVVRDGVLRFAGKVPRSGRGERFGEPGTVELWAERENAVEKGKNFLAVGAEMQIGPAAAATDGLSGLGIESSRGAANVDFQVLVGVRNGKAWLRVIDGRDNQNGADPKVALDVPGFELRGRHRLELRVEPRGEKQFVLTVHWNDAVVHTRELKGLSGNSTSELKTFVFAAASKDNDFDVSFDDYHLERRKDP